jgi:hypothetical protein
MESLKNYDRSILRDTQQAVKLMLGLPQDGEDSTESPIAEEAS